MKSSSFKVRRLSFATVIFLFSSMAYAQTRGDREQPNTERQPAHRLGGQAGRLIDQGHPAQQTFITRDPTQFQFQGVIGTPAGSQAY